MALPAIYNNETNIHIYIGCIKDGGDVEYYRVPRNKTWTKLAAQNRDESISWKVPRHLFVFKELPGSLIIVNDFRQSKPFNNATAREFSKIFRTKSKKQFPWNRGPRRSVDRQRFQRQQLINSFQGQGKRYQKVVRSISGWNCSPLSAFPS